jgi:hypothetical protein
MIGGNRSGRKRAASIGNLFIRRPGSDNLAAPVVTGSRLDTRPMGGKFDGVYGILARLEALEAMSDLGVALRRPIVCGRFIRAPKPADVPYPVTMERNLVIEYYWR